MGKPAEPLTVVAAPACIKRRELARPGMLAYDAGVCIGTKCGSRHLEPRSAMRPVGSDLIDDLC
jgi:hypothetical protein